MAEKKVTITKHALDRFRERNIPRNSVKKCLTNGVRLKDPVSGATLCVYKIGEMYYTLVLEEDLDKILIITGYESSVWQINHFHKVKKHGNKML